MKAVNIHEGIDSTLMLLESRLKANYNKAAITIVKEYGDLPLVECYAGQLNQVFMNVLTNAIDALEESQNRRDDSAETTIRIHTGILVPDRIFIRITDNGLGMDKTVQHQLFNPFFTTKPVGKGTGMGMSISYQIITEKHSGRLSCISEVGKGTEFSIEIPIRQH